jgi:hypothetical protein
MQPSAIDRQRILGVLAAQGAATSVELQAATGKSQATVSRLLAGLGPQVLKIGQARSARYALPRQIHGHPPQHALWWTDESGQRHDIGTLTHLANQTIDIQSAPFGGFQGALLPWYLSPLKAEGFLGRLTARRFAALNVDHDPERWPLETILFAALQVHDAPGAITLGLQDHIATPLWLRQGSLAADLDEAAAGVADSLPAGSSAGGEQPKFLAVLEDAGEPRQVLVKFPPPLPMPGGQRWSDLLHAEHLAAATLDAHGVAAASTRIVRTAARTYLISQRFDRIGMAGRRHVVAIGKVHQAFVEGAYRHWGETALALTRAHRLAASDAEMVLLVRDFGRLIGNTDMHAGNLGLLVDLGHARQGRFQLAPVYDMLPMRYRPNALAGGIDDYTPFMLETSASGARAAVMAADFWGRVAAADAISASMRQLAIGMAQACRAKVQA